MLAMDGNSELLKADISWATQCQGWQSRTETTAPQEIPR